MAGKKAKRVGQGEPPDRPAPPTEVGSKVVAEAIKAGDSYTLPVSIRPDSTDQRQKVACFIVIAGPQIGQVFNLDAQQARIGRAADAEFCIRDAAISRYHARVRRGARGFFIEDLKSTNGIYVNGKRVKKGRLGAGDHIQLGQSTVLKLDYQAGSDREFHTRLYDAGTRDPGTGVFNRRFLEQYVATDLHLAIRHNVDVSLMLIDVDDFKQHNDTHGHLCGDCVLRHVAMVMQRRLRKEDILARYGGDEFAIALMFTPEDNGRQLGETLRQIVEQSTVFFKKIPIKVTVSIGVAASTAARRYATTEELFAAADLALYRAKNAGKNRVAVASPQE